jgi:hypothetical protein
MTKLEQKLIELGYELDIKTNNYVKWLKGNIALCIYITPRKLIGGVDYDSFFMYQFQLDNLQQAFNQLQSDLKELKECI